MVFYQLAGIIAGSYRLKVMIPESGEQWLQMTIKI